jgi:broad specificity phosphatase PhoE
MTKTSQKPKQQPQKLGKKAADIFSKPSPETFAERLKRTQKEEMHTTAIEQRQTRESKLQIPPERENTRKSPQKATRGRPQQHLEDWSKTTVVLLDRQIHWLDKLALDIRHNTKAAVSRAEIIRALIAAIEKSNLDISSCKSETEITEKIASKLIC